MTRTRTSLNSGGRPSLAAGLPSWDAARLKRAIRDSGHGTAITVQGELMRRFGLQLQMKRYLDGKQRPTIEVAAAIARVLDKPIEFFLVWPREKAA